MSRIPWSSAWQEVIGDDEEARFAAFAEEIAAIARDVGRRASPDEAPGRVFHIKKHTGVAGFVRVLPDLEEPLAHGVFSSPRDIPCYVRFSNGAVRKQPDGILDVRGVGLKLVGTSSLGEQLLPDHTGDRTQDFLFVQTPAVPTDSFDEFLALARAGIGGPLLLPLKLALAIGPLHALRLLVKLALVPQPRTVAGATFFNAVPVRYGPAAAKLQLVPFDDVDERQGDTLRDDLIARLRSGPLGWRVRVQLFTDERRTPIERAAIPWEGPFWDVAELHLPRQDVEGVGGREIDALVDTLAFNPWHGVVEHRPLGVTQRARAAAYARSAAQRGAAAEPTSVLSTSL